MSSSVDLDEIAQKFLMAATRHNNRKRSLREVGLYNVPPEYKWQGNGLVKKTEHPYK